MTDLETVLEANAAFYRAFESLDLTQMEKVWLRVPYIKCVHPGWPLLTGWEAVRESWHAIFANTEEMRFTLSDVRVDARRDLAWVTCTENILSEQGGRVGVTAILATNLFARVDDAWLLVHHHASHVLTRPSDS